MRSWRRARGVTEPGLNKLRLDKWLWAARFFRTRSLAKAAIEGGKVHLGGQRVKVSREIAVGDVLSIRQGFDLKEVTVRGLSAQRRGASEAQQLYEESAESIERRQEEAAARRAQPTPLHPARRPSKRERRQIHRFLEP
jgi:ribosome-associated heat shock protein Hsp15